MKFLSWISSQPLFGRCNSGADRLHPGSAAINLSPIAPQPQSRSTIETTQRSTPNHDRPFLKHPEKLSAIDAQAILDRLPTRIKTALLDRATEIEYPIEMFVEMAIASFLDSEALGFVDCKPGRGQ